MTRAPLSSGQDAEGEDKPVSPVKEACREDRLAVKLRENLKKRKEQARLKRAASAGVEADADDH